MRATVQQYDIRKNSPYDLNTYFGRFRHFMELTDPTTLLVSDKQLDEAKRVIATVQGQKPGWEAVPVDEYYRSHKYVSSTFHPDTGNKVFMPGRLCAFIPTNIVTLTFMLHPSQQTPARSMVWQWVNQTANVLINYANRSITPGEEGSALDPKIMAAYGIAVGTSCSVAFAGNKVLSRMGAASAPALLKVAIPYSAVAIANIANVGAMRSSDFTTGIVAKDVETGESLPGPSLVAGRKAITEVAISRVLLPMPLLLVPPIVLNALFDSGKFSYLTANRARFYIPVQLGVLVGMMAFALPMAIAVFPQNTVMPVTELEPQFQGLRNSKGNPITTITFNKGL